MEAIQLDEPTRAAIESEIDATTKALSLSEEQLAFLRGDDIGESQGKLADPYSGSGPVYSAASSIIEAAMAVPLVISGRNDEIIESGPLYELLQEPAPGLDQAGWLEQVVGYLTIGGIVHLVFPEKTEGGPLELYPFGRQAMRPDIDKDTGELLGWTLTLGPKRKRHVALDEVITMRTFNPKNRLDGLDPTDPSSLDIMQHLRADEYNRWAMENHAEPGGMLTTDKILSEPAKKIAIASWKSQHQGVRNARKIAIADRSLKWQRIAQSHTDMQFIEQRGQSFRAIARAFHVPMPVLSDEKTSTYANYNTALAALYENNIAPKLLRITSALTRHLAPRFVSFSNSRAKQVEQASRRWLQKVQRQVRAPVNVWIWPDLEQIPVMQEMRRARMQQLQILIAAGVSLAQANEMLDLGIDVSNMPWAREWWVSGTMIPARLLLEDAGTSVAGDRVAAEGEPVLGGFGESHNRRTQRERRVDAEGRRSDRPSAQPTTSEKARMSVRQQIRIWRLWVRSWEPLARSARGRLRRWFLDLERRTVAALPGLLFVDATSPKGRELGAKLWDAVSHGGNAPKAKQGIEDILRVVIDLSAETDRLVATLQPVTDRASRLGIEQVFVEVGIEADLVPMLLEEAGQTPRVLEFMRRKEPILSGIVEEVRRRVANSIADGLENAETIQGITERVKATFLTNRNRALTIARTEVAQAMSAGRHSAMVAAGVDGKSWITSRDAQVRDTHKAAGRKYGVENPIPTEAYFQVGNSLLIEPSDPSGRPEEIINCRCLSIARKLRGRNLPIPRSFIQAQEQAA